MRHIVHGDPQLAHFSTNSVINITRSFLLQRLNVLASF